MKFDLKRPCPKCPFRTDIAGYLRPGRIDELQNSLVRQQQTFACHQTIGHDDEDRETCVTAQSQHCAGALILLEKLNRPNQMMRIAERLGMYDRTKLDMDAPVFDSFAEMRRAQSKARRAE